MAEPSPALLRAFAPGAVRSMTSTTTYERGVEYADGGHVLSWSADGRSVVGVVAGSQHYRVSLAVNGGGRASCECSCPVAERGELCKHVVALATVLAGVEAGGSASYDLTELVDSLARERLVAILVEHAERDDALRARLLVETARGDGGASDVDLDALRGALEAAFQPGTWVDYQDVWAYVSEVDDVLDSLDHLVEDGEGPSAAALALHAAELASDRVGYVDDADGLLRGVAERLRRIHCDACAVADVDPVALAGELYALERQPDELETFFRPLEDYADLLGEEGLAEYGRLADDEWAGLSEAELAAPHSADRARIEATLRWLAADAGDVDTQVAVLARDLSRPHRFLAIAELLRDAGQAADALGWAEEGLARHGYDDPRLVDLAIAVLYDLGRPEDAVELSATVHTAGPTSASYRRYADQAGRTGVWTGRRDAALEALRAAIDASPLRDGSELVVVLLEEDDVETAWAEAGARGCDRVCWLRLADGRAVDDPDDALPIWVEEVERQIAMTNNAGYAAAVRLLPRVVDAFERTDRVHDGRAFLADLRERHRRKRNLMAALDRQGL